MIELQFVRDPNENRDEESTDFSQLQEWELRQSYILGDIYFSVHSKAFSTQWGWVPLLDVASSFLDICRSLQRGVGEVAYEFVAASDAKIVFKVDGKTIRISSNYTDEVAEAGIEELTLSIERSVVDFVRSVVIEFPSLRRNPTLMVMFPTWNEGGS